MVSFVRSAVSGGGSHAAVMKSSTNIRNMAVVLHEAGMATFLDNRVSTSSDMDAKSAGNPAAGIAAFFGRDGKRFDAF